MSTEHKNGYRQPVNFTKLVKAEFDENEMRFLLLVSDLETAEAYIEKLEQQIACGKKALAETKTNELLAEGNVGSLRLQLATAADKFSRLEYQYKTAQDELELQRRDLKQCGEIINALQRKVEMLNPEYYYLKEGEVVQAGDEAEVSAKWNDPPKWVPVNEHSIGRTAPDPAYMSHTKYRRKIR